MRTKSPNQVFFPLGLLQTFVGLGAVTGGALLVSDPSGTFMGMPLRLLHDSPFPDYLVPGLFLLVVNGIGSLIGAWLTFTHHRATAEAALLLGALLLAWMCVQVAFIGVLSWWQPLIFVLGLGEFVAGGVLWRTARTDRPFAH